MKRLVAFDLDGTLAVSKAAIDPEMGTLLARMTESFIVAVISGGDWPQFEAQLVNRLTDECDFSRLILLPTSGAKLYRHQGHWQQVNAELLHPAERMQIVNALKSIVSDLGLDEDRSWGERIEDRGSQITFSGLGQLAPQDAKQAWDPDFTKRRQIQAMLAPMVPGFTVRTGGSTSVDITRKGIDKGYGIAKLSEAAGVPLSEMMFIGDALYPGGNDHAVRMTGVDRIAVRDITETKRVIEALLIYSQCGQ